ncbi:Threonyl-tRNA synthetase [hydrothermal vent metagenome]|uniref:threonine--tRNA ligase n=1 Tax=hydrothermal vent metagenome TaxID=652676 RepID=A0A3B0QXV0_9ZZZZ
MLDGCPDVQSGSGRGGCPAGFIFYFFEVFNTGRDKGDMSETTTVVNRRVALAGGAEVTLDSGETVFDALKALLPKAELKKVVAAVVGGVEVDLSSPLVTSGEVLTIEPLTIDSKEGLDVYRHTAAHVMAQAIKAIYKDARLAIGPTIENGFYYDVDVAEPFTPDDLRKIEKKMAEIVKSNLPLVREVVGKDEALALFKDAGEIYKEEIINDLDGDTVSLYRQGNFVDLCRGPHLASTGRVRAFRLTTSAGAYWRGDESRKMLQRIYGTAFADKKELSEYLKRLEEAKKRDHRRLGKELDLFSISDEIGAGLVLWHPNGSIIRNVIEQFWKDEHARHDYSLIYTPHIAKVDLWKTSGHWDFYRESLFSPMDVDGQEYIVKPMNCPFHIEIYKSGLRSYRDLPIRYAELGTVYRYERSGVLHGLLRVRGFTQDDAHIYLTRSQLKDEIQEVLKFTLYILRAFGFNEYDIYLSTRPDKYVGSLDNWAAAEAALKGALEGEGLGYEIDPGEGVFYGPKIDIKIKDVLGRSWQCSTIQVDFNLPERFNVNYRNEKGEPEQVIMVHRALMGSLERFFGCLIEHYAGAFPLWLAPVQALVLNVTERTDDYAKGVYRKLRSAGIRAELDNRNETLGYKIREGRNRKVPYMVIVGDKEAEAGLVAPRSREEGELPLAAIDEFIEELYRQGRPPQ